MHRPLMPLVIIAALCAVCQAQDSTIVNAREVWERKQKLQQRLFEELAPLGKQCKSAGLDGAAKRLGSFLIPRDPQRQYVFFPPENQVGNRPVDGLPDSIQARVDQALNGHADRLFEFAGELARQGLGCAAIQNLNEVLYFNPNHAASRQALGHRNAEVDGIESWRVKSDRLKIRTATRPHAEFDWPAKSFLLASTTHFQISSRAGEEQTRYLARQLERWHEAWRQVFFTYNISAKTIVRRMEGKSKPSTRNRKYKIVFFSSKEEYVRTLSRLVPGVAVSSGYYDDQLETSFFYASGDRRAEDTWRHELTHQLFQESRRSIRSPFEKQHLWLGEGIAMYFESLVDQGDYAIVGGFDARRLQYARLRRLKEQFKVPLQDLASANKDQFQAIPDLAKVYSQSAGMTHYLMDSEYGAGRERLVEFLRLSYQGKLKRKAFEKLIGKSFAEIETQYDRFLRVGAATLSTLVAPKRRTELCLIGSNLEDDSLNVLRHCENLRWIDLSACDVRDDRLRPLRECKSLRQLFLTGAKLNTGTTTILADLSIAELDLSGSNLTDEGLARVVSGAQSLRVLNVAGTKVSPAAFKAIASHQPELEILSDFNQ